MATSKQTNGKDPAVLLYTQDFIVGTFTWTYEQKGKYITLLCLQHQKQNKLTDSDLSIAEGDELILEKFPKQADGYYSNERMSMEINNRKVRTDSSRNNGLQGGRPKGSTNKPKLNLKETQDKPMGYNIDNLRETYNKPNNNPTGNGNEVVVVNENIIANEDVNVNVTKGECNILQKYLDNCIEYNNTENFKSSMSEIISYGGLDKVFDTLEYSDSQKMKWSNQIKQIQANI